MPCALVSKCKSCNEYLPITSFYKLNKENGRACSDGSKIATNCGKCSVPRRWADPLNSGFTALPRQEPRGVAYLFNLELSDIKIPSHCPILGIPLVSVVGCGMGSIKARNNSPSIDRIDNTKGYVKGNVTIISMRANDLKVTGRLKRYLPLLISSEITVTNCRPTSHGPLDPGLVIS